MSEHLCLCVCVCVHIRGQQQVNPHPPLLFILRRRVAGTARQVCVSKAMCAGECVSVCVCVQEWKRDRARMMTDGNVIHPLIIYMPHLYSG